MHGVLTTGRGALGTQEGSQKPQNEGIRASNGSEQKIPCRGLGWMAAFTQVMRSPDPSGASLSLHARPSRRVP